MVDSYQETVGLVAKFTVESLQVKSFVIIILNTHKNIISTFLYII